MRRTTAALKIVHLTKVELAALRRRYAVSKRVIGYLRKEYLKSLARDLVIGARQGVKVGRSKAI